MMLTIAESLKIFTRTEPVDMRKSINGLCALVVDEFSAPVQSGHLFVFYNKNRDKVKLIFWDKNGFVLYYKRLERGRFKTLFADADSVITITSNQLSWLLAGLDFQLMQQYKALDYTNYY